MTDIWTAIAEIFASPVGRSVFALAGIATVALTIVSFWTNVRLPRRNRLLSDRFQVAPPSLKPAEIVGRSGDGFFEARPAFVRHGVLALLAGAFVVIIVMTVRSADFGAAAGKYARQALVDDLPTSALIDQTKVPSVPVSTKVQAEAVPGDVSGYAPSAHLAAAASLCDVGGSLSDGYVEVCERGAQVRLDLLRLEVGGVEVVKPAWDSIAPTFVRAESHAAPFGLAREVAFKTPDAVAVPDRYDGYLVVGVAEEGEELTALQRAEELRRFAVLRLSGGDRAACLSEERVYTTTATFDEAAASVRQARRAELSHLQSQGAATAGEQWAQAELLLSDAPGPIVVGITADPLSSDPDADMTGAAERFLASYGPALQLRDIGPINAIRACARGNMAELPQ
ncbi:MAG: hypothetical protein AAGG79_00895 [Pseudomonadota bacterium]